MSWLEVGDRVVKRTGLYRLTMIEPAEPRPLRWWPLLILVSVAVGYAMIVTVADPMILRGPFTQVSFLAVIAGSFMFFAGRCTPAILLTMNVMISATGTITAKSIRPAASRFQNPTT